MPNYQYAKFQCVKNNGPVPEGLYYVPLIMGDMAEDDGSETCRLKPSWRIEEIPRGGLAGKCEIYWANWGYNRVRFEPANLSTKIKCSPQRNGFYLHDSTKGYSHGCIEVEDRFFNQLRRFAKNKSKNRLTMRVVYSDQIKTNGGTKI